MTVATEASYAELVYTGAQSVLVPGFAAQAAADVHAGYLDPNGGRPTELIQGTHFTVTLDASGNVTVGRLAFPPASVLNPLTLWFERVTPAVQGVDFENLHQYSASVHQGIADAGAMRDAELRNRQARTVTPFFVSGSAADFRPLIVKAADPANPEDLVTKAYSDAHTGTAGAERAEAAADRADAAAAQAAADRASTDAAAAAAEGYAALLGNPDYGFYTDIIVSTRDYGTYT